MLDWLKDKATFLAAVLVMLLLFVGLYLAAVHDAREWQKYSAEHHCVAKGVKHGQVVTSVGPSMGRDSGVAVTTGVTPDQTIYVCDGGEMVIR
jgi:hypothetical protein